MASKMKPQKTISELIDLLKSRNLTFEDSFSAEKLLSQINYYRLSGYWRKYQINPDKNDNNFVPETTFEKIIEIYELDTALRNLLQKGLGIFEICFRSKFAYHFAHSAENGQLLYLQQKSYDNSKISENEKPSELLEKIEKELERSKEKFILHLRKNSCLMLLVDEINQNNEYSDEILELCRQNSEFYKGLTEPTL